MKYSIVTFGCRVNQADSLAIEEQLLAEGGQPAAAEQADVVVVNTCSVTASADQGARQAIRRLARNNPRATIIVTGCYATRRPDEIMELARVTVVPNPDKLRLTPSIAALAADTLKTADRYGDGEGPCGAVIQPGIAGRTAFTLRVQTGCSEPCSYCIIPQTRGAPQSRPLRDVLVDVERVRAAGFKEVAITGVHLGSYGRDLDPASSLVELLQLLVERCGPSPDLLFRISSLEPMDCTSDVVTLVASAACLAPHFHLPLQHASNRILAAMRRPYTIADYEALVDDIRRRIPDAAIGSDVIVGFPGETEADFEQLVLFLDSSPLTHVHVFPYSDRPGTAAAVMSDKVPGQIVRGRAARVRQISERLGQKFRERQRGVFHRALTLEDGSLAVTGNYIKVRVPPGHQRNEWITVQT
jgi:threonylcarbamoyladenosine tRNA methylthiotransferase MtaB